MALAYLRHFGSRSQAVVQHDRFRRILNLEASRQLYTLLDRPGERFRPSLVLGALRNLGRLGDEGQGRIYLNVGHTGLNSAGFRDWVATAHVRPVYMVHDLIPITHPQFCRPGEDVRHRERMLTVLQTSAGVVANSHATLDELGQFARHEGLKMPAPVVAWLGVDPLPKIRKIKSLERSEFVTLGTIEARKNHLMLLNIWAKLIDRLKDRAPQLLIVGQRGWEARPVFDRLDNDKQLRGHVVEINHCSDDQLAQHLGSARALLFPSLAEGYGLPLIEALGAGLPAIVSDLPVFREIGGDIPMFIRASDQAGWEEAIVNYADSSNPARGSQLRRMRDFASPSWTTHFNIVDDWLERLS